MATTESWSNETERPNKRKRVALACEACRSRKVRCDGTKPICRSCEKRGETAAGCIYAVVAQTAKHLSEQEYVSSLQRQIQDLHKVINEMRSDLTSVPVTNTTQQAVNQENPYEPVEAAWVDRGPPNDLEEHGNPPATNELEPAVQAGTSPVSAMGATTIMPNAAIRSDEFYGQSSLHSLLQEVPRYAEQHRLRQPDPEKGQHQSPMLEAEYALPPRQVADQLLRQYFENVHIFYPWTLSTSFQRRYESLWTSQGYPGNPTDERGDIGLGGQKCALSTFMCALNAMFALGCEISNLPQKESTSAMFSSRMRALLHADMLDHGSLSHIQALLLAGHYLLTTDHPTRCYNVIGLACRMAVGAGMHSNRHAGRRSVVENEMRRRVWYGCLQTEMTVCMTLGRPPLLQITDDVPLPAAVDDTHINVADDICLQPEGTPSQNIFMVENIKLAKILYNILSSVYCSDTRVPSNQATANASPEFSILVRLDSLMEQFKASLPEVLDWSLGTEDSGPIDIVVRRQRNVLHARFLHLRILLYRPSFSSFFASTRLSNHADSTSQEVPVATTVSRDDTLSTAFRDQCANICLNNVFSLINALETATKADATGAWWFSLLYLMTCCGILILADCSQNKHKHFDQQRLDSAWDGCITTLNLIGRKHFRAKGYLEHLCTLRKVARSACSSTTINSRPPGPSRGESMEPMLSSNDPINWDPEFVSNNLIGILDTDFMASNLFHDFEWHFEGVVQ